MARKVGIVGAAVTPFKSKWYEKTYYELAQMATREALADAAITPQDVDAVIYGIYNDIFERTCIPEHPLQGITWLHNKPGRSRLDYFDQFGLRFSLKAEIPSRASADSRACR